MCKVSTIGEAEMFTEAIFFIQLDLLHSNTSELYEILNKICLVCVCLSSLGMCTVSTT